MNNNFYTFLKRNLLLLVFGLTTTFALAQDVKYSETFTNGQNYCAGDPQYDNWLTFRAALDTGSKKFLKVTVKGTNDATGVTCDDPQLTRRIAEALRSRTFLSVTCDGRTWRVAPGCAGGCGNINDAVELIVTTNASCACSNPSYIFRPIIGNGNWGGINGQTCGAPNQTMEVIFSNPVGNNAAPGGVTAPVTSCGGTTDSIAVSIRNAGINKIAGIPVTCIVDGTLGGAPYNQTFNTTIGSATDSLDPFTSRLHTFTTINTSAGADLDIVLYTALSSDTTRGDDTLRFTYKNVGTPTGNATANNVTICGTGSATLNATVPSGHSAYWYNAANELVAVGTSATSPVIPGGTQDSFFVASAKVSSPTVLGTDFTGTTSANSGFEGGNMFDINPRKHITIESFDVHIRTTTASKVTIYMKQGSFRGFETNMGAWTKLGDYDVTAAGLGNKTTVTVDPIELMPGSYGFYIYANDGMVWNTAGNNPTLNVSDFDLNLSGAVALRDPFANQLGNNVRWDGEVTYRQTCVANTKTKVVVTANPLPVGSDMKEGTLFKGTFDAGTTGQPDIIASPDSICYDIPAPTNFNNSGFGSTGTWNITSVSVKTLNGTVIPATEYSLSAPVGSVDAKLCFFPTSTYTDSTVEIEANVRRLDNNCDSLLKRVIFIAPRPVPVFTNTTVCLGEATEFKNTSTISSGTVEYEWDFANGVKSTLTDPAITYATAGNFNVTLKVTSDKGYVETITQTVTVKEIPDPNFNITNACEGTALTFTDNSILPTGTPVYAWDFGDGNTGSGATVNHQYAAPNIYPVKLTIDVAGCSNSIIKYGTQAPRSTPDFGFVNTQCDNLTIPFTNGTTAPAFGSVGYVWKFGDGNQAAQISPSHTYNVFQVFDVTLVATTDLGCVDSVTKQITLKESPKPTFASAGQTCTNSGITFTNNTNVPPSSTNTYDWTFGDGNTSTDDNPSNTYVSPGTYEIVLKASSTNGCDGETKSTITIDEKPVSEFVANNVCEGEETKFTNGSTITSGTLTYTWDLDDGNPTTSVTNPTTTYASPQTYNVSLVSESASGCTDTVVKPVDVYAIPPVDINIASNQTQDGTMLFSTTTTGAGLKYFWTFGDGGNSDQQNPTYKYNFPGTWPVRLVIRSAEGCENSLSTSVFVNPLSVGNIDANNWSIYPNPSAGKFVIKYEGADIAKITISDVLGKTITSVAPELDNNELAFDISNQKAGVYLVTLTDVEGNRSTQRITLSK